jgi:hypothetical protein
MTTRGELDKQDVEGKPSGAAVGEPRALSLDSFSFNFTISTAERVRAYGGLPSHVLRLRTMEDNQERYFGALQQRYDALWLAAAAGSIDEDGREVRQTLFDEDGRDRLGELQHARRLFRERRDPHVDRCEAFNRAWLRHLDHDFSGLDELTAQMDAFNEVFPIEADLPTDPKTGEYMWMGKPWKPLQPPTQDQLLDRCPLRQAV